MLLAALMVATAVAHPTDDYPKNPRIDIVHYRFELGFPDADDTLRAEAVVSTRFVAGGDSLLRLDLIQASAAHQGRGMTVQSVREGDHPLRFRHDGDVLWIDVGHATIPGELVTVRIAYRGRPAAALAIGPNKYGDRTIFSDNWPDRARNWLPTVDHPYDKATSEMVVTAPAHYQVVSNGILVEETDLGHGMRRTSWSQDVPIATWLYTLGVAEFAVDHRPACAGVPIQTWVYREDRDAGFHDFATPTCDVLEFFSSHIGPYSYAKLANVVSPVVNGGMEAATAIAYGEASVTGTRALTWQNVIVHELAHQWFGNAVTEADWDDVWLSEGFATYFTLLYREHARGRDDFVAGLRDARERVRAFYDKTPDYRVVHQDLQDMKQVTNGMTYQKGAWTLQMLRERIGDEAFWRGIRRYYREHRDANASTADFQQAMEQESGQMLGAFFDQWLRQGGIPALDARWHHDARAGETVVTVTERASPYPFTIDVDIAIELGDGTRQVGTATVSPGHPATLRLAAATPPREVVVDPDTRLLATWTIAELRGGP